MSGRRQHSSAKCACQKFHLCRRGREVSPWGLACPALPGLEGGHGRGVVMGRAELTLLAHSWGPVFSSSSRPVPLVTRVRDSVMKRAAWLDIVAGWQMEPPPTEFTMHGPSCV